jgi:hypothetical protein
MEQSLSGGCLEKECVKAERENDIFICRMSNVTVEKDLETLPTPLFIAFMLKEEYPTLQPPTQSVTDESLAKGLGIGWSWAGIQKRSVPDFPLSARTCMDVVCNISSCLTMTGIVRALIASSLFG